MSIPWLRANGRALTVLWLVTFVGVAALSWRNVALDTPTYASDEYAYLVLSKFYGEHAELFANDAWLQRLTNWLYFAVLHAASKVTPDVGTAAEFLNTALYALSGLALATLLLRLSDTKWACLFLVLYFVLPWGGYTASIQPEVTAYFCAISIGLCAVAAVVRQSLLLCAVAGFATSTAFYIKPNAVGVALATAIFLLLAFGRDKQAHIAARAKALGCYAGCLYIGLVVWPGILGREWRWLPQLVSGHYAGELSAFVGSKWQTLATVLAYSSGLLAALLILFPAAAVALTCGTHKQRPDSPVTAEPTITIGLAMTEWTCLAVLVSVVLVAYYSAQVGAANALGKRLHLRYLGFTLPLLLWYSILWARDVFCATANDVCGRTPRRAMRLTGLVLAAAIAVWIIWIERQFRTYPWDSPELSAFYSGANTYWREAALLSVRGVMLLIAALTAIALLIGRRWSATAAIGYLVAWMVAGNYNNTAFHFATKKSLGQLTTDARSVVSSGATRGPGAVVGADRYGAMSYALFGLAAKPVVLVEPQGGEVLRTEVPANAQWVICVGDFVPRFKYSQTTSHGHLRFYLLQSHAAP